jgi:hypothetical protein
MVRSDFYFVPADDPENAVSRRPRCSHKAENQKGTDGGGLMVNKER